jgi:hypothetical protein
MGKVCDQSEALRLASVESALCVSDHILLQHSPDIATCSRILSEDILRAAQTALFCCVPVELDGVLELAWAEVLI